MDAHKPFASVERIAANLGVPETWLRAEVASGRIPHLKAGRKLLLNREVVERVLLARAAAESAREAANA